MLLQLLVIFLTKFPYYITIPNNNESVIHTRLPPELTVYFCKAFCRMEKTTRSMLMVHLVSKQKEVEYGL